MAHSYEKNGRFYFSDGWRTLETSELIDCSLVVHDSLFGYIYKSRFVEEYKVDFQSENAYRACLSR